MNEDQHDESSEAPEWRVAGDEQLETDAYHVWKPRPLLRSVHWKPVPAPSREAGVGSYDVFVDQRVLRALHQHIWNAAPGESPQGFLVGDLCEDPDTGRRYVIVSAAVPSRFPMVEEGPEQIQGEALVAMQLEVDRRRGVMAGWYHRHREGPVELTAEDLKTHERHFPEPWQIALLFVTDHAEPAGGCFRRTRAGMAGDVPLPFFEMVSNESLLARGVRRSHMDWLNVETVDSIDLDPPSRPEPLPEPEPEPLPEPEPEPEPLPEPDASEEAESLPDFDAEDDVDSVVAPEPAFGLGDSIELGEVGPADGLEDVPVLPVEEELEVDLEVLQLEDEIPGDDDLLEIDDVLAVDDGVAGHAVDGPEETEEPLFLAEDDVSALEPEEIMADLEAAETEFTLPVLDEPVSPDLEAEVDVDLPEPGWDSGDGAADLSLPPVDDVDLDSFVTEVESADVEAQVDATIDMETIEPGWDDVDVEESPVVDVLPVPDFADDFDDDLSEEPDEVAEAVDELEPAVEPVGPAEPKPSRLNRTTMVVGGVLVTLAIVVSVLVFLLPSGGGTADGGVSEAVAVAGAEAALGQGEVPVDDPPTETGESAAGEPVESPAVADSLASPASVVDIEELGDGLLEAISRYYGRAVAVDGGQATCSDLQAAYVEVEDSWIAYNVEGRARFRGRLPDELATRDERLYAGVQDVEREFTRSRCERP